jgi:hypothetical protein
MYPEIIPQHLSDSSRVWIYQCNRPFNEQEILEINEQLHNFYSQWTSHGAAVNGWAQVIFNRFVVVLADENEAQVGGCSTDSMVRVIKSFERQYNIDLFDRMSIAFLLNDKVEPLPLSQVKYAYEKGMLKKDTPVFNNLVSNKKALLNAWLTPLHNTWIWDKLQLSEIETSL